jgi:glucosamine--fructose-6-phosphate aminotransferase (isomerizing)
MCGIIGYTGTKPVCSILLNGLRALEYRGYDSAGVALSGCTLTTVKRAGRISVLEEALRAGAAGEKADSARCGIGHTRWATHGAPTDENAHPHSTPRLALVHNGIIENDRALRAELTAAGYVFTSETNTEAAAKLLDSIYAASVGDVVTDVNLVGTLSARVMEQAILKAVVSSRVDDAEYLANCVK